MPQSEDGVQLIKILKDSGLMPPEQLEKLLEEYQRTGDSFLSLLRRDVGLGPLRDLMLYEIPLPFGKGKRQKIRDLLIKSGLVTDEELVQALREQGEEADELGEMLVRQGLVTESQLKRARKQQLQTGHPLWRTLINLGYIEPSALAGILRGRMSKPKESAQDDLVVEILAGMELITPEQRAEAEKHAKETGGMMVSYLLEKGYITPEKVGRAMQTHLDIPYVDLARASIDERVVYSLPENLVRNKRVLPIRREGSDLHVAMVNPLDQETISRIQLITGCKVHPVLVAEKQLASVIDEYFRGSDRVATPRVAVEASEEERGAGEVPAVQLATSIIEGAITARATDIHLEPQLPSMRVRYRIDGQLYDVMSIPQSIEQAVFSRIKILADMDITERRRPQDGHITMRIRGRELNMRIATIPTYLGEKMVIRLLDESTVLRGLKQLGLEESDEQRIRELLEKPHGMILVTGPVGAGKTTTLYSCLNELNILQRNIVTIEDPVEYRLPGITQVQVNPMLDLTFARGLRAILRQDPDILMVGEIRDAETAKVATWAALTGQLVLATLHTKDTASAITMMANFGVERFLLASGVIGVIAQRLVRKLCTECRESYPADPATLRTLGLPEDKELTLHRSMGCETCQHTGFFGRTGIFEVLKVSPEIVQMILDGRPDRDVSLNAVEQGMRTLRDNGIRKIEQGVTVPEEVLREVVL
jgi:type IV pilus assembly protein PilB